MKLWEKGIKIDQRIEAFTIGKDRELDIELAKYDVIGSKAHVQMLTSIGMITAGENEEIQFELDRIAENIQEGLFVIEDNVEDVHSQIELLLTRKLGDTGKKIHLGRSRNDQILLDLRLFFRDKLNEFAQTLSDLIHTLLERAKETASDYMPGYTHMQLGMVSSYGLWFSALAEGLLDDLAFTMAVKRLINRNPLGTAAGYGSSIPIDRQETTQLLDFDGLCINPINAQLQRGKTELLIAQVLANLGLTLNKFSYDLCLYSNENYRFFSLPEEFTTGSSIMPHKKNPDVFELIRASSNELMTLPMQITHIVSNLPTGYHRDYQLLKEILFPRIASCHEMIVLMHYSLKQVSVNPIDVEDEKYKHMYSVERVNDYVKEGMSFRNAYMKVSTEIAKGMYKAPKKLEHSHIGSIGNLGLGLLRERLEQLMKE